MSRSKVLFVLTSSTVIAHALAGCYAGAEGVADEQAEAQSVTASNAPPSLADAMYCPGTQFFFAGACRTAAWAQSTFGGPTHPQYVTALGSRARNSTYAMVIIERTGNPASRAGYTVDVITLNPVRAETVSRTGVVIDRRPNRAGWVIAKIERRSWSWPAQYTDNAYQATLQPPVRAGVSAVAPALQITRWSNRSRNNRTGVVTLCDSRTGCRSSLPASGGPTPPTAAEVCAGLISDSKNAMIAGCAVGEIALPAAIGCDLGATGGAGGGPLGVVVGCGGGVVAGGALGTGAAAVTCAPISELMMPDLLVQYACERALSGLFANVTPGPPPPPPPPPPGPGPDPNGPGMYGACSHSEITADVPFMQGGQQCWGDAETLCSGQYTAAGDCQYSDADCFPAGYVDGSVVCGTVTSSEPIDTGPW